jgi:hypothetical protein
MTDKKIKVLVLGLIVFGFLLQGIYTVYGMKSVTELKRPKVGEDEESVTLNVKGEGFDEEITFRVDEQQPSKEALDLLFQQAKNEVDESFLGENPSTEVISKNVVLRDEYANGLVDAKWSFSPNKIIRNDGKIDYEEMGEDTLVMCTVDFEAYEQELSYSFPVYVKMPDVNEKEGFLYYVQKTLNDLNQTNQNEEGIDLPTEVKGCHIVWKRNYPYTGLEISLLGVFAGILIIFGKKYDSYKNMEKKMKEFEDSYPEIISALTLYMGAGLSVCQAFEKIGQSYQKKLQKNGKRNDLYENVLILNREIQDGKNMRIAFEGFGRRCLHPAYKKMMMLLEQNIRKGNEYLLEQLEREEKNVYESRQRKIKMAGEVASTKLLIPMTGLLGMVLIVLVVPALFSIRI